MGEEEKQLQSMMYNLMIGNQEGFNEIDHQRKSENSYRFSFEDQLKQQEELLAKENAKSSTKISEEPSSLEELTPIENDLPEETPASQVDDDQVENDSVVEF